MAQPNILPFQQPKRELKIREKGRGARSNVTGRYEPLTRERSEEDWDALPLEDRAPGQDVADGRISAHDHQ